MVNLFIGVALGVALLKTWEYITLAYKLHRVKNTVVNIIIGEDE